MKILQLCHKTPLPTIDGGCIDVAVCLPVAENPLRVGLY